MRAPFRTILTLVLVFSAVIASSPPAQAASGDLDPTFGRAGHVTTDFFGKEDNAWAMAIQPDGRILAAGSVRQGSDWNFGVARYTTDGSLDPTFGTGGLVATDFAGGADGATAIALQPDGKIVIAGSSWQGASQDFSLVRYESDGSLDASFGSGGKVIVGGFQGAVFSDVAVQGDGAIVAVGSAISHGTAPNVVVMRFLADG